LAARLAVFLSSQYLLDGIVDAAVEAVVVAVATDAGLSAMLLVLPLPLMLALLKAGDLFLGGDDLGRLDEDTELSAEVLVGGLARCR
jgi:hypothetical protein